MIGCDCARCRRHCCGALPGVRAILMPWESARDYQTVERGGLVYLQRQPVTGNCVYYDGSGCRIYHRRPFECRLYPLVLSFDLEVLPRLRLDGKAECAATAPVFTGALDYADLIRRSYFPPAWIRAYEAA